MGGSAPGETPFPLQNLPFGIFRPHATAPARAGVAIGAQILDLPAALSLGLFDGAAADAAALCRGDTLNELMAAGREASRALRLGLSQLLRAGAPGQARAAGCLVPQAGARLELPARIGDFTDFFTSTHHAENVRRAYRAATVELPNLRAMPLAYHGRASTVMVSGTPCRRPRGQFLPSGSKLPVEAPSERLDYELEVGFYVGQPTRLGEPLALAAAERHVFGLCLVNDWSARDIQRWESAPLGPFLGKNFLTSVSPWVVTLDALAPFRVPHPPRGETAMPLLPGLDDPADQQAGAIDLQLSVAVQTAAMRKHGLPPRLLGQPRFRDQYWSIFQMLSHHTANGCALRAGDLLASGTVSGADSSQLGCLLELAEAGARPVSLPDGESRSFLADGDEVIFEGWCRRDGYVPIGLGECRGRVEPAG